MRIPLLAILYAVFLSYVMIDTAADRIRTRTTVWQIVSGLVSSSISLLFFVGYWISELVRPFGFVALFLLLSSLGWTVVHTWRQLPTTDQPEFTQEQNRGHGAVVLTLVTVLSFPAYWYGGIAAIKAL